MPSSTLTVTYNFPLSSVPVLLHDYIAYYHVPLLQHTQCSHIPVHASASHVALLYDSK